MTNKQEEVQDAQTPAVEEAELLPMPSNLGEVITLIRARIPLVQVITHDETELIKHLHSTLVDQKHVGFQAKEKNYNIYIWSAYQGLLPFKDWAEQEVQMAKGEWEGTTNPVACLRAIAAHKTQDKSNNYQPSIYIMRDINTVMNQPFPRALRDMYAYLQRTKKHIVGISASLTHGTGSSTKSGLEPTLEKQMVVVNYKLPNYQEVQGYAKKCIKAYKETGRIKREADHTQEDIHNITRSLQGLTVGELTSAIYVSLADRHDLDPQKLLQEKKQIITKSGILEYIESSYDFDSVGGFDVLKKYINDYTGAHGEDAKAFGVEPLKGILLTGIPGTGKSMSAKALGNRWKIPTLRLDVGKVMTGLVGGSEQKMREVIAQATAVAPCITGDTLITLTNGKQIRADKLYEYTKVFGWDSMTLEGFDPETNETIPIKMYTMLRRDAKEKEMLEIATENGTIKVTEDHKLFTKRGWVEAKNLVVDDEIIEVQSHQKDDMSNNVCVISFKDENKLSTL